ncbi:quaternary ammonium compound-resistance protein SugE [Kaistia algarum]|uniref:DMT family transporter n=1 Tax=Kaistia algarum TaxID=2083279 RepID=UPI000CE765A8|nr:quaternary ammonium compound efflux SMR transporter SugE [Kaistia algarum]MCX5512309.1 quaternary ammonium compound efflux SMR transporter SugE [Kaistia algarum]PPE80400.1 quaternary ammonium compound-resistance protein SugE [Kaistia algarum]
MAWFLLFVAGLLEIGWAVGLRATDGFSRPLPTLLTIAAMIASIGALGLALRTLPLGTAYAIWTGIGTVGTVIFGIAFAGESASPMRLGAIAMIVLGIAALKLTAPT